MTNTKKPLVSIIVAAHNEELRIEKCLKSLISQSLKEIEIIVVDDCSNDKTAEIIKQYAEKDSRIKLIRNKRNLGLSGSRNVGIKYSSADNIMFCDSDDYYEKTACEKMFSAISKSNIDLAINQANLIYDNYDKTVMSDSYYYALKFYGEKQPNLEVILNTDVSAWNKIFKKSILEEYSISFPEGLYYEDAYFSIAYMMVCGNIYYLNESLYNYVRRKSSIMSKTFSSNYKDIAIDHLKIAFLLFDFMKKHQLLDKYNELFWSLLFSYEQFAYYNSNKKSSKRFIKKTTKKFITEHEYLFRQAHTSTQHKLQVFNNYKALKLKIKQRLRKYMPVRKMVAANIRDLQELRYRMEELNK